MLEYSDAELGEVGPVLPIGIYLPSGERVRDFSFGKFTGNHEVKLGDLEDELKDDDFRFNRLYSRFLPTIIESIGGYTMMELSEILHSSPQRIIQGMYVADIISLIINIRFKAYGNEISISGVCPCPEQYKIRGEEEPHDLGSLLIRSYEGKTPPEIRVPLIRPIPELDTVILKPLTFERMPISLREDLPVDIARIIACSNLTEETYNLLCREDIHTLKQKIAHCHFGPERKIEMECPACMLNWDYDLPFGGYYEQFYLSLLSPPRTKNYKSVSNYLNEIAFFLTMGESAPFKSVQDVFDLTPVNRDWWVNKLSETYKKQKEEMDKASSKAKSKR